MKRFFTIICAAAAIAASVACSKFSEAENVAEIHEEGELVPVTLSVEVPSVTVETRDLTAYTDMLDYEKAIYNIQYLVYKTSNGSDSAPFYYYKTTSATDNPTIMVRNDRSYNIYAVVNCSQDCSAFSENQLLSMTCSVTGNEKTEGFFMGGSTRFVSESSSFAAKYEGPIELSFMFSRVCLAYIKHDSATISDDIEIIGAYLANVSSLYLPFNSQQGNYKEKTFVSAGGKYYNYRGYAALNRNSSSSSFPKIDGSTTEALMPNLTYKAINKTLAKGESYTPTSPDLLYYPAGYNSKTGSNMLYISIIAKIDGVIQYFHHAIDSSFDDVSKSHTLGLTITGFGADEPLTKTATSNITLSFNDVALWGNSDVTEANI